MIGIDQTLRDIEGKSRRNVCDHVFERVAGILGKDKALTFAGLHEYRLMPRCVARGRKNNDTMVTKNIKGGIKCFHINLTQLFKISRYIGCLLTSSHGGLDCFQFVLMEIDRYIGSRQII